MYYNPLLTYTVKRGFLIFGGEKMKETTIAKKSAQVDEIASKFEESSSIVFVDYLGLTVDKISELRRQLYNSGCELKVVKNNILRRAAHKNGYEGLDDILVGPSAVALSKDATNASKIIYDFAKNNNELKVKSGVIEGKVYEEAELKVLASLPNKDGMLSMLLSVLQAPVRNLAYAIKAVSEKEVEA